VVVAAPAQEREVARMTNHVGRLYSLALTIVLFFVLWAAIAARPWARVGTDPRMAALAAREQHLRQDSILVRRIVAARWAVYRVDLARTKAAIAAWQRRQTQLAAVPAPTVSANYGVGVAAPAVRVVTLPPLTITRTS
jgi:hypothetical protein